MNVEIGQGHDELTESRVVVYLDDDIEPLFTFEPPVRFELDTSRMEDGRHYLRIEAYDETGQKGVRVVPFTVRNGPGISISGLRDNDVLEGRIPILVNSYGGTHAIQWEPSRAETPAPIPTWAWVIFIVIVAFGVFYGVQQWNPPPEFAATPTYGDRLALEAADAPDLFDVESAAPAPVQPGAARGPTSSAKPAARAGLGKQIYNNNCASCHQVNGQGLPGVFPSLVGGPVVTAQDPTEHIEVILNGRQGETIEGVTYASPMPGFAGQLSDAEIAAVANHERTSWGNSAPTVTAQDVAKLR